LEKLKGREHSEDIDVNGKTILELILGKHGRKLWTGCVTQDRDQWRDIMKTVMNIWVP